MKLWLIGGTVVGLLGASLYLAAVKRNLPAPAIPAEAAPVVVVVSAAPPAPHALTDVVDVTNIDSLLDPVSVTGPKLVQVGFEDAIPGAMPPSVDVKPIPKAVD